MRAIFLSIAAVLLASAARAQITPMPEPLVAVEATEVVTFKPAALAWATKAGRNSVGGDAFMRTRGGQVITCAGGPVRLLPVAEYTRTFVLDTFGSAEGGAVRLEKADKRWAWVDANAFRYFPETHCNSRGEFLFSDLPDGSYYVIARVSWETLGGEPQGGEIARLVRLIGGQSLTVSLTP